MINIINITIWCVYKIKLIKKESITGLAQIFDFCFRNYIVFQIQ